VAVTRTSHGNVQRKGPVRLLEDRIAELQTQLAENNDHVGDASQQGRSLPQPDLRSNRSGIDAVDHASIYECQTTHPGATEAAEMDIGLLSMRAMAEPCNRASEFLKELSMPRIISAVTETYGGNPEMASRADPLWDGIGKHIRRSGSADLERLHLRRSDALQSLETYLNVVDFRYPRLPVKNVEHGINAITAERASAYDETLSKDPAHIFLAYMVMAIVPLVSDIYPVSQGSFISIHLLTKSLKVLEAVFKMEDGVDIIQCLHLLVIFSIHSSAAGSSWLLIGVAMKKCIALGYHREAGNATTSLPQEQLEQRRWAFWSCYLLDRLISSALGRPFSINDRYVSVAFPGNMANVPQQPGLIEARHVRLFRYCVLLSEVVADKGSHSFAHHLSHLLHWQAGTISATEACPAKEKAYFTSLYNTLLLRIIIDQIRTSRRLAENASDGVRGEFASSTYSLAVLNGGQKIPMRIFETCLAVIRSLNRTAMRQRSFLSWITGYSALSVALGALYCMIYGEGMSESENFSIGSLAMSSPYSVRSDRRIQDSQSGELLHVACRNLEVVARQFPRMQTYRQLVLNLQHLVEQVAPVEGSLSDLSTETRELIVTIEPDHLKDLASVVYTEICNRHEADVCI